MKLCSIASGSSGNCIFLGTDHTSVLIDAGISGKRIEAGLRSIDRKMEEIDAILVTHEHSDHIKGLGILARRYGVPIYLTEGSEREILRMTSVGKIPEGLTRRVKADTAFQVGDLTVKPFRISHDAAEPVGYRLESGGKSAAVATDLGIYDDYTIEHLQKLDALLLESNHDVRMLEAGKYPYYLKRRILGEQGHLSNVSAGQLLGKLLHDDMKAVFLGHLSRENNYEALAYETVCQEVTLGENPYNSNDFRIAIAHRDEMSEAAEF